MGLLSRRGAPSLLRMVRGKQHASDKDHEGPAQKKRRTHNGKLPKTNIVLFNRDSLSSEDEEIRLPAPPRPKVAKPGPACELLTAEEEDAINAEPLSSSDEEIRKPPPLKPRISLPSLAPEGEQEDKDLRRPRRKSERKAVEIKAPVPGSFAKGKIDKAKLGASINKESVSAAPSSSLAGSVTDGGFTWSMEHSSQKSSQNSKNYGSQKRTTNIHAPAQKKTFGKPKGVSRVGAAERQSRDTKKGSTKGREDSDSEVSMKDPLEYDAEELETILNSGASETDGLKKREKTSLQKAYKGACRSGPNTKGVYSQGLTLPRAKSREKNTKSSRVSKPALLYDDELADTLKAPHVHAQLEDWMYEQAIPSSQPDSSASLEALESLQDYIQQLPDEEIEGTQCTLCKSPVEMEDYWEFWKGKDKTVKNHTAFCNAHQRKSAHEEYRKQGYPTINWEMLPARIRKHKTPLSQILSNHRPSIYRDRYEPLAVTGKAAAVPSRRKDLPEDVQQELASYALDDQSTHPGYYGPHGRRVITEQVMKVLKKDIKNCKDAVVQASGPAAFVQAVLVPEMAVLLIIEDCEVDRQRAEEIREQTYDMGMLLHEEIEDELEGLHDSEEENEYQAL